MPLDEMKNFFSKYFRGWHKHIAELHKMKKMTQTILDFTDYFAEKNDIFKK